MSQNWWLSAASWLERQPKALVWVLSLALVIAVSLVDYATPKDYSFTIVYLLPLALASWVLGRRAGIFISLLAAACWLAADAVATLSYSSALVPLWNTVTRLGIFLLVSLLLPAVRRELAQQQVLAITDSTTGLVNRRGFLRRLEQEMQRSQRYSHPFSIAFVDLDNFKGVNDRLGHVEGDRLLRMLAAVLDRSFRATDTVARLGGDEFALLMPETPPENARTAADKLVACREEFAVESGGLTLSAGVITFLAPPPSISHALRAADRLMYEAKEAGKNTIRLGTWGEADRTLSESA